MSTGNLELAAFDRALHQALSAPRQPELADAALQMIAVTAFHWFDCEQ